MDDITGNEVGIITISPSLQRAGEENLMQTFHAISTIRIVNLIYGHRVLANGGDLFTSTQYRITGIALCQRFQHISSRCTDDMFDHYTI